MVTKGRLLSAVILFLAFAGLVSVYAQRSFEAEVARRYPAPGRLLSVGRFRLHIRCTGSGPLTVVLESGSGGSSNIWALVQPQLESSARVCSYDRAGLGWSDARPMDVPTDTAGELHQLLTTAGEHPPFVVVGHSLGGEHVRVFAARYPNDVAGLVLVATGHPDTPDYRDPGALFFARVMPALTRAGLLRIASYRVLPHVYREYIDLLLRLPQPAASAEIAFLGTAKCMDAVAMEIRYSDKENKSARNFGSIPLIVISEQWVLSEPASDDEARMAQQDDELQLAMARFSSRGKRIMSDGGHMIPITRPELIVSAVNDVLAQLQ